MPFNSRMKEKPYEYPQFMDASDWTFRFMDHVHRSLIKPNEEIKTEWLINRCRRFAKVNKINPNELMSVLIRRGVIEPVGTGYHTVNWDKVYSRK